MAIDRSKFKSTPVTTMVQKDKEIENKLKTGGISEYHSIEKGKNLFRIYPPHPDGGGDQFAEVKCVAYLPTFYEEKDDKGNVVMVGGKPKMKEGRKSVFNARIHGNATKDLVEEYISFMEKLGKENIADESRRKSFMEMIKGKYSSDKNSRIPSSDYQTSWTLYADKYPHSNPDLTPEFGRLEIKKTVKERLNKLASQVEGGDDPLQTDPFTPVEEGRAIIIDYNPDATEGSKYYTTDLDQSTITEKIGTKLAKLVRTYPLSDDQLENFLKAPSLYSMFRNVFKRKDFDFQLSGLKILDDKILDKFNIGAFTQNEWLDICDEISEQFPEESEDVQDDSESDTNQTDTDDASVEQVLGDDFDSMDRVELKNFIQLNRTGIIIKSTDTDDSLRDKLREWKELQSSEETEENSDSESSAPTNSIQSAKDRIAALKAKAGIV